MAKGQLGEWVDKTLYPAMYRKLDEVFPTMKFVLSTLKNKWISPKNIDGTDPRHPKKDKTFVLESVYHLMQENGGGDTKDLITKFQEFNNIADRIAAIKEIAKILSLDMPEGDLKKWEERKKKAEALALSYDRQKRALFSPEGAEVLRYLKEDRGYPEELIKTMGLGFISPAEAKFLNDNFQIGFNWRVEQYPLSIAHFSDGDIIGFNCRCISKEIAESGEGKYRRTTNLNNSVNNNPFGIIPNNLNQVRKKGEVVIVEGELDALHAIALGLPNVVAASTGNISRGKVETLKKYKYENVVILLDADGAGEAGTEKSILTISDEGLNAFVATIPDGKDTDEFLQRHSIDELKEIINNANFGELWLYFKERSIFEQTPKTDIDKSNFLKNYVKIASRQKDAIKRERLYSYLLRDFPDVDITSIEKGIREEVESRISEEESEGSVKRALKDLREASTTISEGNTLEGADTLQDALRTIKRDGQKENALKVIKKGTEYLSSGADIEWKNKKDTIAELKGAVKDLKEAEQEDTFASLLKDNTEELWDSYKVASQALKTNISFWNYAVKDYFDFSFPSGAISIIGAQTNHGKSKVLQSIALDTIESMEEGETVLYITYEESEGGVNAQFLNSYFNDILTRQGVRGSNLKTITDYLTTGSTRYMNGETIEKFFQKENEWKTIRREGKIKIVRPDDNFLQTLTALILYATKKLKVKAIFIDYVQEIYVEDWSKYSRTDELKQAMVELDAIAQRTNLPIIMAAQLSKEAVSPLDLYNQFIADSSWIGRKASEIILIWSNKFDIQAKGQKEKAEKEDRILREIPDFKIGDNNSGQLYLKITKSRFIPTGSYAIVNIDANTGRVKGNLDEVKEEYKRQKPVQTTTFKSNKPKEQTTYDNNVKIDVENQKPYRAERDEETEEPEALQENNEELPF